MSQWDESRRQDGDRKRWRRSKDRDETQPVTLPYGEVTSGSSAALQLARRERLARKRLFDQHLGRLIDLSTVFTIGLGIVVVTLWIQGALYNLAYRPIGAHVLLEVTHVLIALVIVVDIVRLLGWPRPIIWPEPGSVTTLAGAPVHSGDIARPLRRRAVLYSLGWRLPLTLLLVFIVSGYMSITWWGVIAVLVLVTGYTFGRETIAWHLFHSGARKGSSARPKDAIDWDAFLRFGERRLNLWQSIGIGQIGFFNAQQMSLGGGFAGGMGGAGMFGSMLSPSRKADEATQTPGKRIVAASHLKYNATSPITAYMFLQLGRTSAGFSIIAACGIAIIIAHNLPPIATALYAGLAQVWCVWALSSAALREQHSLPWMELFPWSPKAVQRQVFLATLVVSFLVPVLVSIVPAHQVDAAALPLWLLSLAALGAIQAQLASEGARDPRESRREWSVGLSLVPWALQVTASKWPFVFTHVLHTPSASDSAWELTLFLMLIVLALRFRRLARTWT
ncbi:MAG: hypothetical protein OWU32_00190 [Firmicutes bacterium]|nr:hypothetical protein [Bacillota bacterium]